MTDQINNPENQQHHISIGLYAERAYLEYAMSVVKGRALPNVSDGQKPVQRRILYAMKDMGLDSKAKPVKSARVVGEILGKYHPHGDASAYDAMVRMAQDFTLRYPLIDGIGNFGSRDGDSAAAMRYTEARLTKISDLLLSEINLGTIDFIPNYDGTEKEPIDLPARLPFVLLNGASGIAVGMATEIPSHNLTEIANALIALLKNPNLNLMDLMDIIQGPDFSGGGQIITAKDELISIYQSGKGSVRVRARYSIEKLARGQWRIIVHELPPGTSTQKILSQIEDQTNPKVKTGKKQISLEQQNTKSLILSLLEKVRDESDGQEPVRLVFEPKSSRIDATKFINILMAQTDLELNVSINLVMIGRDNKPAQKNLKSILSEWINFRIFTVTKRFSSRLEQVEKRIHILQGRMIAFLHIDEIIAVIKESEHPKQDLIQHFALTEIQAEDILEIRLRQLAKLEWIKLESELKDLESEKEKINYILSNESEKRKLIIREIETDKKEYGDKRRTIIKEAERSTLTHTTKDEPITLILSQQGWIRARSGHNLDLSLTSFKEGDSLKQIIESRTILPLIILDSTGRTFTLDPAEIPNGRGDGVPVVSLIELSKGAKIIGMATGLPDDAFIMSSSSGYGFIVKLKDMISRVKSGKAVLTTDHDDVALSLIPLEALKQKNINAQYHIIIVSSEPKILAFPLDELKYLSKGKGLQLIKLPNKEKMIHIMVTADDQYKLLLKTRKNIKEEKLRLADILSKRGAKGKIFSSPFEIIDIK